MRVVVIRRPRRHLRSPAACPFRPCPCIPRSFHSRPFRGAKGAWAVTRVRPCVASLCPFRMAKGARKSGAIFAGYAGGCDPTPAPSAVPSALARSYPARFTRAPFAGRKGHGRPRVIAPASPLSAPFARRKGRGRAKRFSRGMRVVVARAGLSASPVACPFRPCPFIPRSFHSRPFRGAKGAWAATRDRACVASLCPFRTAKGARKSEAIFAGYARGCDPTPVPASPLVRRWPFRPCPFIPRSFHSRPFRGAKGAWSRPRPLAASRLAMRWEGGQEGSPLRHLSLPLSHGERGAEERSDFRGVCAGGASGCGR